MENDNSLPMKYTEWHESQNIRNAISLLFVFRGPIFDNLFHFRISGDK